MRVRPDLCPWSFIHQEGRMIKNFLQSNRCILSLCYACVSALATQAELNPAEERPGAQQRPQQLRTLKSGPVAVVPRGLISCGLSTPWAPALLPDHPPVPAPVPIHLLQFQCSLPSISPSCSPFGCSPLCVAHGERGQLSTDTACPSTPRLSVTHGKSAPLPKLDKFQSR